MRNAITIQKRINAPISEVLIYCQNMQLIAKHLLLYKLYVLKILLILNVQMESVDSPYGLWTNKPIQEEITLLEENKRIEYKLINNPLVKHHLGKIDFKEITTVYYFSDLTRLNLQQKRLCK